MSVELKNDDYCEIIKTLTEVVKQQNIRINEITDRNGDIRLGINVLNSELSTIKHEITEIRNFIERNYRYSARSNTYEKRGDENE